MGREGVYVQTSDMLYRALVQNGLLYGHKTWMINEPMLVLLEVVHMGCYGVVVWM